MILADKVTAGTYNFVSLVVKIIVSGLSLVFLLLAAAKIQCFVDLSFNSTLQLINGILNNS